MPEFLTTREVAELLRIKERKVYDLAASGSIPHTKAMGKLLFPRDGLHAWLAKSGIGDTVSAASRPTVFLGSHDPLLDWALRESQCGIASWFDGSCDGLDRFEQAEGLACGLHLLDPASNVWNEPFVNPRFGHQHAVLVRWAKRQRGLIVSPALEQPPTGIADLQDLTVAPRQPQSGAQNLFESLLEKAGLSAQELTMTPPVRTEVDAALAVLEGQAQVSFGLATLATQYRLPFVPIIEEQFDILVDRRAWFDPPMQTFLNFCRSKEFQDRAARLTGYDISAIGQVRYNAG